MSSIIDIFVNYGWEGINAIILILILFYGGKFLIKKISSNMKTGLEEVGIKLTDKMSEHNQKLSKQLAEQNSQLIGTIVSQQNKIINHIIDNNAADIRNHNVALGERMELTEDIKNALKDIGQIHNCQRAFIIEFHNSYQNLSGTPFAKFSCTYEWVDKGITPLQLDIKDLQFGVLSTVVRKVYKSENQQIVYNNIKNFIKDCPALAKFFTDSPAETMVCTAMYDHDNKMIGGLILVYTSKPDKINLNQLHIQAAELTSMINLRYKYIK